MNQLQTPNASRNQEAERLSLMGPVSGAPVSAGAPGGCTFSNVLPLTKAASVVAAAALLPLAAAGPALAAPSPQPKPPAVMSTVGGARLGKPGTQVDLANGAPVLPKELSGRSWIVADAESGAVLAAHNAHWRLAPASTMKMLFADTLLPKFPKTQKHLVGVGELSRLGDGSSLVGIKEKHTYTVHDLWLGVFLRSGNDAVHALAEMNGGIAKTVREMNARADELQALDTEVVSPDGYDAEGQVSSAYDLTLIARSGMQNKDFREYCSTVRTQFPGEQEPGGKRTTFEIQNTNRLLTGADGVMPYKGIAGVKNGTTTHAGSTFTGVAERNGRVLLVTVMNPSSKEPHAVYKEAARLLDWGFAAAGKARPVGELVPPRSAKTGTAAPSASPDGPDDVRTEVVGDAAEAAVAGPGKAGSDGAGVALAVAGGVLATLAGAAFVINRRWPAQKGR
ncbi:D-alanyl-D-alanine carboxypeptidase [Streptomyces sp. TRM76323]|uniref:D-alanyl-D-alanine carboxypeptidase n=1 Tax=Streptomyces tamarix TaxID=3078565 RepID=A0ABU3QLD9_9ACTN|nr:D-alanyl-D-alanine carboxypeptidase [Streptomyces tamarix]MDT9683239.1 D-alanyl-D-alanine carboxypeptidase [Streptomyces tamarix]